MDRTGITVQESFRRYCQILRDEGEQRDDVTFDGLQLLVEVNPRSRSPKTSIDAAEALSTLGKAIKPGILGAAK